MLAGAPLLLELSGGQLLSALGLLGVLGAVSSSGTLKLARLSDATEPSGVIIEADVAFGAGAHLERIARDVAEFPAVR